MALKDSNIKYKYLDVVRKYSTCVNVHIYVSPLDLHNQDATSGTGELGFEGLI